jgi:hypothetical protein
VGACLHQADATRLSDEASCHCAASTAGVTSGPAGTSASARGQLDVDGAVHPEQRAQLFAGPGEVGASLGEVGLARCDVGFGLQQREPPFRPGGHGPGDRVAMGLREGDAALRGLDEPLGGVGRGAGLHHRAPDLDARRLGSRVRRAGLPLRRGQVRVGAARHDRHAQAHGSGPGLLRLERDVLRRGARVDGEARQQLREREDDLLVVLLVGAGGGQDRLHRGGGLPDDAVGRLGACLGDGVVGAVGLDAGEGFVERHRGGLGGRGVEEGEQEEHAVLLPAALRNPGATGATTADRLGPNGISAARAPGEVVWIG